MATEETVRLCTRSYESALARYEDARNKFGRGSGITKGRAAKCELLRKDLLRAWHGFERNQLAKASRDLSQL